MKVLYPLLALFVFTQCIKGESYCELPPRVTDVFEFGSFGEDIHHQVSDQIEFYISVESEEGTSTEEMFFSLTTPKYFINTKGDYETDVVVFPEYTYQLKDTLVFKDTIEVEIYTFNDCGRSNPFKKKIIFN